MNTTERAREMNAEAQAEVTKEQLVADFKVVVNRSEERRVGKECVP